MTLSEAQKVADILKRADGGCPNCVGHLVELATEAFPEFEWSADDPYEDVLVKLRPTELSGV